MISLRNVIKNSDIIFSDNVYSIKNDIPQEYEPQIENKVEDQPTVASPSINNDTAEFDMRFSFLLEREKEIMLRDNAVQTEFIKRTSFNEGYEAGLAEVEAKLRTFKSQYDKYFETLAGEISGRLSQVEKSLTTLSIEIFNKVLDAELKENNKLLIDLVKRTVEEVKNSSWISITLSNKSEELVRSIEDEISLMRLGTKVEITTKDAELGTCIVETSDGVVDSSVYTQLENLRNILT